ncbi:hypothetical protein D3C81_193090 [compost metagenome]
MLLLVGTGDDEFNIISLLCNGHEFPKASATNDKGTSAFPLRRSGADLSSRLVPLTMAVLLPILN